MIYSHQIFNLHMYFIYSYTWSYVKFSMVKKVCEHKSLPNHDLGSTKFFKIP